MSAGKPDSSLSGLLLVRNATWRTADDTGIRSAVMPAAARWPRSSSAMRRQCG